MTQNKSLWSLLLLVTMLFLSSCAKDATEQAVGSEPEAKAASKLIFTSEKAIKGQLLVKFREEATQNVETSVMHVTRSGGVATRSGIADFDVVLSDIGVKALQRLFPIDIRNEERTRAAGLHRWYIVEFDDNVDLNKAALDMARVSEVNKVEFNQQLKHVYDGKVTPLVETGITPQTRAAAVNDPYLSQQWHYINTGNKTIYSKIKAGADVNCGEAWELTKGDPRVIVAVVDNSVQWDHPDLAANMWVNEREKNGSQGADDDSNGYKDDIHGYNFVANTKLTISTSGGAPDHGTHVAGTVAAVNNNGIGVAGVAGGSGNNDGVKIMSCQIFYNKNGGDAAQTGRAIKYAADNGAAIIQCSFGYDAGAITSDSQYANAVSAEKEAIDYFMASQNCDAVSGGLVIFAAGNEMTDVSGYPGAYRDYISVTSMSCDYTPAYYTNYGPACNVAAPGGDVYQSGLETGTYTSEVLSTINNGQYGYMQGTSMACPHMSGVAALGLSYALKLGKRFTRDEFASLLLTSVNDINQYCTGLKNYITDAGERATINLTTRKKAMGTGYIDAYQVLMNVRGITCIPIPTNNQYTLNLQPYLGSGDLDMKISGIEISGDDMNRLGITSAPTISANQIIIKCTKSGSAVVKIKLLAGTSNNSGMNGMPITKEFALIARESHSQNGGWL